MTTPTAVPASPRSAHVDVFDGLRAIAIILVVWLHTWQLSWMRNDLQIGDFSLNWSFIPETGFTGVELFFFISGFCLFYPFVRHALEQGPQQAWGTYFYRRAIKIVPSYLLSIALVLALFKPQFFTQPDWAWLLGSHLLFVQNLSYGTESAINGVLWSLAVEVQFYLLFPLVCWAFLRRPVWTYVGLCLLAIAWRGGAQAFALYDYRLVLDQLPGYIDFFANGLMAAYVIVHLRTRFGEPGAWRWAYTAGAMAAMLAFGWLLQGLYDSRIGSSTWPWDWQVENRTFLGFAFLALGVCSAYALGAWRAVLANPAFAFLSTISYNLYIYHQLIARELVARRFPAPATADPHADPNWAVPYMVVAITLSIVWAAIVTYAFERPLLKEGPGWLLKPFRKKPAAEVPAEDQRAA